MSKQPASEVSLQNLLPTSFVVTKKRQESYLARHGIMLTALPDGSVFVSVNRPSDDLQNTRMKVFFRVGASNDPLGKEGLSHLAEHMVFLGCGLTPTIQDHTMRTKMGGYYINAMTSLWDIDFTLTASSGLVAPDFGFLYGVEHLGSMLTKPLLREEALKKEKRVVFDEIGRLNCSLEFLTLIEIFSLAFSKNHPCRKVTIGTGESVRAIKSSDIRRHISEFFTPPNSFVSIFSEGNLRRHDRLVKATKNAWTENFKGKLGKPNSLPSAEVLSTYRPFLINKVFEESTKVRESRVLVCLATTEIFPFFTREGDAFGRALSLLRAEIFHAFRGRGYGYAPLVIEETFPLAGVGVLVVGMEVDRSVHKELAKEIRQILKIGIQRIIETGLCEQAVRSKRLSYMDSPIPLETRLEDLRLGLRNYGQIIRSEDVRDVSLSVKARDVKKALEFIADSPNGLFITGDF